MTLGIRAESLEEQTAAGPVTLEKQGQGQSAMMGDSGGKLESKATYGTNVADQQPMLMVTPRILIEDESKTRGYNSVRNVTLNSDKRRPVNAGALQSSQVLERARKKRAAMMAMMEIEDAEMRFGSERLKFDSEWGLRGTNAADREGNHDRYEPIEDNSFEEVSSAPLSTFSVDVDTAAYAKMRMYLFQQNSLPPPAAVRIEELVNYFDYGYQPPRDEHPFSAAMDISQCPWNQDHRLARIGIKGKVIDQERPASNLVFLLDVSGSMNRPNRLPLVIKGMKMLTSQLSENDSVAIVVYAGAAGLVLDSTSGDQKQTIVSALERLKAGGSTNGGEGIMLAYQIARDHFITGGTNRVILCSDGDFNVGLTDTDQLVQIAKENAKSNIYLSVLGFGMGNHNDELMEKVSNKGNGNYAFIDSEAEA
ncbi:MAG: von Willebrand factor type A domain-containing protein, partial [Pirellulales bacterium]|nr:von Willebrand factor type A domain-containing protein [Pirellulales bacterium]